MIESAPRHKSRKQTTLPQYPILTHPVKRIIMQEKLYEILYICCACDMNYKR